MCDARMFRVDLLHPSTKLSSNVTKWAASDDAQLLSLIRDNDSTLHYRQEGVVGAQIYSLECVAYADAGFAGCFATLKSTTGGHLCIDGPNTHFPLHALSADKSLLRLLLRKPKLCQTVRLCEQFHPCHRPLGKSPKQDLD